MFIAFKIFVRDAKAKTLNFFLKPFGGEAFYEFEVSMEDTGVVTISTKPEPNYKTRYSNETNKKNPFKL